MTDKARLEIRCEMFRATDRPVVELDEEEESILNVNHEGGTWWVYIARWADA